MAKAISFIFGFNLLFINRVFSFLRPFFMKKTIQKYYQDRSINVVGLLKNHIEESNEKALRYIKYAIKNLLGVKGVEQLLEHVAQVVKPGNEGERIYYNSLMELHAIYFVHNSLKLAVLEVESRTNKVLSPNRKGDKSCDIKATNSVRDYYFESKDASSEIMTSYEDRGHTFYTPMDDDEIREWVIRKSKEANEKGANYLVCRVPVWVPDAGLAKRDFYNEWITRVFEIKQKISRNSFVITLPIRLSSNFEGIYIIKEFGYLKLRLK